MSLRFGVTAKAFVSNSEVRQPERRIGMVWAIEAFANLQRPPKNRLGFLVVTSNKKQDSPVVHQRSCKWPVGSQNLLQNLLGLPVLRIRLSVLLCLEIKLSKVIKNRRVRLAISPRGLLC